MIRVRDAMKASFRSTGDRALDPGLAPLDEGVKQGMVSGLDLRRPVRSRSGVFVDAAGSVLTTTEVLQSCSRLTIEGTREMTLRHSDPATGLALLTPATALAPPGIARFQTAPERPGAEIAVAGFPYEDALSVATLTFGRIEALTGLNGEAGLKRLTLPAQPGDAGGPVVDGTGAVVGLLMPAGTDPARQLPPGVGFATSAATVTALLQAQGIAPVMATAEGALPPEDLARRARAMTVLVSCWN
jgi:S1-C subfamily serine protease